MIGMRRVRTPEERQRRAKRALRRAVWYLVLLGILLLLMARPELLTAFLPGR